MLSEKFTHLQTWNQFFSDEYSSQLLEYWCNISRTKRIYVKADHVIFYWNQLILLDDGKGAAHTHIHQTRIFGNLKELYETKWRLLRTKQSHSLLKYSSHFIDSTNLMENVATLSLCYRCAPLCVSMFREFSVNSSTVGFFKHCFRYFYYGVYFVCVYFRK